MEGSIHIAPCSTELITLTSSSILMFFIQYAFAPALNAESTSFLSLNEVSIIIFTSGRISFIALAASIPFITGIDMSMSTISALLPALI